MKISIGDIVDRFTICKLKSERLQLDLSQEINELTNEINDYDNLDEFIDKLYEVNGNIWDLESDIRKGNEAILGLEEIGRRALKIRDFNNIRVSVKNEINSKLGEGFVEYKMNHGSEKEKSLIISLTTVPERLKNDREDGLKLVITSLCEQIDNDYEVHFNVPTIYSVTQEPYIIPNWLNDFKLKYPHLKIFRTEDLGPPTKFVPTLSRIKDDETILLVVDDDLIYDNKMVSEHRKYQNQLVDGVIGYDGRGCEIPTYFDLRDSWIICVTQIRETHFLQHYKSVSYKKKLFKENFFNDYLGKTFSDDVLISKYFRNNGVKMYVVPYEPDLHLFETSELWNANQGVVTFPILRYASSVENTGCNHPDMLQKQPKFFEPAEFNNIPPITNEVKINTNGWEFNTDKYSHGYMSYYVPMFLEMKNVKKVLEIGVYQGDSLKMLSHYFNDATIYGIDTTNCSHLNSDKIITYVYNQENKENLQEFIELSGGNFDLIIDDGGNTMRQQQTSFGVLFKSLNNGGVYIIEDLHTSKMDGYHTDEDNITTLTMLTEFAKNRKLMSNHINDEDRVYIENNVSGVDIWSRTPNFDESVTSIITKK